MGLSESRFRQIIREEARRALQEGTEGMSILHPGVSLEDFVGSYRRVYSHKGPPEVGPADADRIAARAVKLGLDPERADELARLVIACEGPGEVFPFRARDAGRVINLAIGRGVEWGSIETALRQSIEDHLDTLAGTGDGWDWRLIYALTAGEGNDFTISHGLSIIGGMGPEAVAARADFMDSLYAFAEKKDLPDSMRRKLLRLARTGAEGVRQAAELYAGL